MVLSVVLLGFFRDPRRATPSGPGLVISPADGRIAETGVTPDGRVHAAVFLSLLDVHVNRVPISGRVISVTRCSGTFHHAASERAARENACVQVEVATDFGPVFFRQIAGRLARRVSCRLKPGDYVVTGQRFGLIYFGSRMELHMPSGAHLLVECGKRVRAGESVLAELVSEVRS